MRLGKVQNNPGSQVQPALGETVRALGQNTIDVYLNAQAYWRNVPVAV